jgi:GR25 family glycosyltransferase involved in LPS biosynthesis
MFDLYVINLKERTDRKEQIIQDFAKYTNVHLEFIEGIKHEDGAQGCFLSHKKCIQLAKENKMEYIIVVEDDCCPNENFESRLNTILEYLKSRTWGIFLGGVNQTKHKNVLKKDRFNEETFLDINFGTTAHFIIYHNSSYDFFLNLDAAIIDMCWSGHINAIAILPFLAVQRVSYSNIEKMKINYAGALNKTQTRLLELLK